MEYICFIEDNNNISKLLFKHGGRWNEADALHDDMPLADHPHYKSQEITREKVDELMFVDLI
jgi:hypothetical protein